MGRRVEVDFGWFLSTSSMGAVPMILATNIIYFFIPFYLEKPIYIFNSRPFQIKEIIIILILFLGQSLSQSLNFYWPFD